jgi:hypothetical protein
VKKETSNTGYANTDARWGLAALKYVKCRYR